MGTHRSQFQQAIIRNDNGIASMSAAGVTMERIAVNAVQNQFTALNPKSAAKANKGKGKSNYTQNKGKGKGGTEIPNPNKKNKGKGKGTEKPLPSKKLDRIVKEIVTKSLPSKIIEPCAWCSSESHKTFQCVKRGDGKWENKQCNICKGYGHPRKACPNFVKK